jgi:hypothetical protein
MFPYAAIAQGVIGGFQTIKSAVEASKLPDDQKYTVGPEMRLAYNMSRRRAEEGYSPEEKAAFEQMLARQGTAAKRMFQNVGLSGAGSAAANIMGIDATNDFFAKGADIRRQNFGQFANLAGQVQGVQNMETGRFNQQLNMERRALGQGVQSGIGNIFGGINAAQNMGQGGGQGGAPQAGVFGGAADPFANNPSPMWNSFESQGTTFLPYGQQQTGQQPIPMAPTQTATPMFGSPGFGGAPDWSQI